MSRLKSEVVMNKIGVYIHFPYCEKKCPYCDFNSHVTKAIEHQRFLDCYKRDFDFYFEQIEKKDRLLLNLENCKNKIQLESIFFGGGTPSLMEPFVVAGIIDYVKLRFKQSGGEISDALEITLEANPSSFEVEKFRDFKLAGVNRVSIGVQSFIEEDLKKLGRVHDKSQAINAITKAREIFDRFSFDLIYAREGQNVDDWKSELKFALETFAPSHISLYSLTIEKGTEFFKQHIDGTLTIPENQEEFYDVTNEICAEFDLNRYEISNYAKPQNECRHNILYWQMGQYIGIGAGAHGRIQTSNGRCATMNFNAPQKYLESIETIGNAVQSFEILDEKTIAFEQVSTGLRTIYGFETSGIESFLQWDKVKILIEQELVVHQNSRIIPTVKGLSLCDGITKFLTK